MTTTRCTCGHDTMMRTCLADGQPRLFCTTCHRITMPDGTPEPARQKIWYAPSPGAHKLLYAPPAPDALKLPGLDRGKQSRKEVMLEKQLVGYIKNQLTKLGYEVKLIGQQSLRHSGTDVGVADIQVSRAGWGFWLAMEAKPPGTVHWHGAEQERLVSQGFNYLVQSLADALAVIKEVEDRLQTLEAVK